MTIGLTAILLTVSLTQTASLEQMLTGKWTGTLQYRDYRSDRRVTLPTTLAVSSASPGVLRFDYTYDDGPGKIVKSSDLITIDRTAATYRVQNDADKYDATFTVTGLKEFGTASPVITLLGRGEENGVAVDLRTTVTLTASALTMLRESRKPGEDWLFRNEYRLTR